MRRTDVTILIDSNSRDIEFCVIEGIKLDPHKYFRFARGQWVGEFPNFPIHEDDDLDVLIIVRGNPRVGSDMMVQIDGKASGPFGLYKPFNKNGYGQFNSEIPV